MTKPELGSKHKCQNCGAKFFDLNKHPITCPKCGTTLQVSSAGGSPARAARENTDDGEVESEAGPEVLSLEDADSTDDGKVATAGGDEDVDVEEEDTAGDDDDNTFLEEDEEDSDNVSDLIDGDIQDDEER